MAEATERSATERVSEALRSIDGQIEELRERFERRFKGVRGRVDDEREKFDRRWRESAAYRRARELRERLDERRERIEEQWKDTDLYKRAEARRQAFDERVREGRSRFMDRLGLASRQQIDETRSEIANLERKLKKVSKQVKQLADQLPKD